MTPEGYVRIELSRSPGAAANVSFQQPGNIGRLLRGKRADDAVRFISRVYSVCATAQAYAAAMALEQALGIKTDRQTAGARAALAAMETLREHVLRIAFGWPVFCGAEPSPEEVAEVMKLGEALRGALFGIANAFDIGVRASPDDALLEQVITRAQALLAAQIFGEPLDAWRARRGMAGLGEWAVAGKTVAARLFASIAAEDCFAAGSASAQLLLPPAASRIRDWLNGAEADLIAGSDNKSATPETTLFTRNLHDPLLASVGGDGLGARLLARLVELSHLPERMRVLASGDGPASVASLEQGFGASAIDAARGLLVHAVELHGDVIQAYGILSPTRWNFDANGVAARCLSALDASGDMKRLRQAHLIVSAIDRKR